MGNHSILLKKNIINKKLRTGKMKLEEKKKLFNKMVIIFNDLLPWFYVKLWNSLVNHKTSMGLERGLSH